MRRNLVPAAALVLALVAVGVAVACSGGETGPALPAPYLSPSGTATNVLDPHKTITVYAPPDCGHDFIPYLVDRGYLVNQVSVKDINAPHVSYGVPRAAWSCPTSTIGKYVIEGPVPVEAIDKLLAEKPKIDGIALPGPPSGAPGMSGEKTAPFKIVAIKDGVTKPFMTI